MNKGLFLILVIANSFMIDVHPSYAYPLRYNIAGNITDFWEVYTHEPGVYEHPPFHVGASFEGFLNWDSEITLDSSGIQMNGAPFLELSLGGTDIHFDYNYLRYEFINSDSNDSLHLFSYGGAPFIYGNQQYSLDISDFIFYGPSDLFDENSYPTNIDFSAFTSADFSISIYPYFLDLSDGSQHSYLSNLGININLIQAVPEPPSIYLVLSLIPCIIISRFFKVFRKH